MLRVKEEQRYIVIDEELSPRASNGNETRTDRKANFDKVDSNDYFDLRVKKP